MDQATTLEFKKLNDRFDKLLNFIREHMATKEELKDLELRLPSKDDCYKLQSSVDRIADQGQDNRQEIKILGLQADRMEDWITRAAPVVGLKYKP